MPFYKGYSKFNINNIKDFESSVVIKTINFKKTTTEKFSFPLKDEVISN